MKGTRKIALIVLSVILVVGALAGVFVSRIGAANHQKKLEWLRRHTRLSKSLIS